MRLIAAMNAGAQATAGQVAAGPDEGQQPSQPALHCAANRHVTGTANGAGLRSMPGSRPTNVLIASFFALLPWPALYLIDRASQPCGDGLCGFFPSVIALGVLALLTIVFLVRGMARKEQPALLQFLPLVLWLVLARPLFI